MSIRTAAWIAWSTLAFACSCELFGLYFQAANGDDQFMRDVFYALAVLAFPAVGALVAARRPANPIGWIFCAVVSAIFGYAALQYGMYALVTQPGALPGGVWMAWLGNWAGNPGFNTIFTFTLLLFPDGQLPSPRWRPVAWLAGGV
ncbi:MAG TPA: TRIC cation channel family protein, partial [Roseiflexaceae bacterium]